MIGSPWCLGQSHKARTLKCPGGLDPPWRMSVGDDGSRGPGQAGGGSDPGLVRGFRALECHRSWQVAGSPAPRGPGDEGPTTSDPSDLPDRAGAVPGTTSWASTSSALSCEPGLGSGATGHPPAQPRRSSRPGGSRGVPAPWEPALGQRRAASASSSEGYLNAPLERD